jgi:hypothetical protein
MKLRGALAMLAGLFSLNKHEEVREARKSTTGGPAFAGPVVGFYGGQFNYYQIYWARRRNRRNKAQKRRGS